MYLLIYKKQYQNENGCNLLKVVFFRVQVA